MAFFPIFLTVKDHPCLVVGGGNTATRKIDLLLQADARIHVVAPQISSLLQSWVDEGRISYRCGTFVEADLSGCRLVIAATNDNAINQQVSNAAKAHQILVNVVDSPESCDFIVPSMLSRDPLQVAISTGGAAPVLARLLRARLESLIPAAYGQLAALMAKFREPLKQRFQNTTERRDFWESVLQGPIAELVLSGQQERAQAALTQYLAQVDASDAPLPRGEVYLVGGGPGDPDLLTFRALRLMQQADVVVYDRLVSPAVLNLVRREAERVYVGKKPNDHTLPQEEINELLAQFALQGKKVLRLKGGDPFVFGRGGEEIETLMAAGVPFQVVPGITAALGASAYAGIPLTHRDHAQACVFVTGHLKDGSLDLNWSMLTQLNQTVVVYMGLRALGEFCHQMIAHGLPADYPAALVQKATTSEQKTIVGTLQTLPDLVHQADIHLQSLIIVGTVVTLQQRLSWFTPPPGVGEH
jgi:uroporphyrin-III C-methyltransferase / precorrin-2 dehydrogenase / sirohydrochlorin ferrochelatase